MGRRRAHDVLACSVCGTSAQDQLRGPGDGDLIAALRFGNYSNTFGNGFPSIH